MMRIGLIILLTVFLISNTTSLFSQQNTINCFVYNASTKQPLEGVNVKTSEDVPLAISDKKGYFQIAILPNTDVSTYLHFEEYLIKEFSFKNSDSCFFYLKHIYELSFDELLNLVVYTAGKMDQKVTDVPASIMVLTNDDIQKSGYRNLEEILQNVTGLFMTDEYFWLGTVNYGVRGLYTSGPFNNFFIMVNGVNQVEEYTRGAPMTKINVPVEAIHKIEVIRGPMSVIYGSGAFMGAVNIITNEGNTSTANVSYGSENSKKIILSINRKSDDHHISFNASLFKTDGLDVPYTKMTSNPIQSNGKTLLENNGLPNDAKTGGTLWENRKYFNLNYKYKNFTFDATHTNSNNGMVDMQPTLGNGSYFLSKSYLFSGIYDKKITEKLSFKLKSTYSSYYFYINYEQDYLNTNKISYQNSSFIETEADFIFKPTSNTNLIAGLYNRCINEYYWGGDYINWGTNFVNFLSIIEKPFYFNAVFFQGDIKVTEKLSFVTGLRAEQVTPFTIKRIMDLDTTVLLKYYKYKYTKVNLIPRFALIYKINHNNVLKFMYGKAIKQPELTHIQTFTLNPEWKTLRPANNKTFEMNYICNISSKINTNFSVFYNFITDMITRMNEIDSTGKLVIVSKNEGEMTSYGSELRLVINPVKSLIVDISGSYQISNDQTPGFENIEQAYSPKFLGYMNISYNLTKNITVSVHGRHVAKMLTYYDKTTIPEGRIGKTAPAYTVINANIRWNNIYKGLYAELYCQNATNKEIHYPTTTNNAFFDLGAMGHTRMLYFTMGVSFR